MTDRKSFCTDLAERVAALADNYGLIYLGDPALHHAGSSMRVNSKVMESRDGKKHLTTELVWTYYRPLRSDSSHTHACLRESICVTLQSRHKARSIL